jgi:hypothetical protein
LGLTAIFVLGWVGCRSNLFEDYSSNSPFGRASSTCPHRTWHGSCEASGFAIEQVIEGEPASVLAIAARILADPRHADIVVTAFGPVGTRRFDDWRVHGVEFGQVQKVDFCNRVVALRRDSDLSPRRRSA